jgi:uncharacterized protein (TIGR02001 family)
MLSLACLPVLAAAAQESGAETVLYGELTVASDYLFRGVSQTMSEPALQVELGFEHPSGWYGFVWGSNVDFCDDSVPDDGARTEVNLSLGREIEIGERVDLTLAAIGYLFPGTNPGVDYDYTEWLAAVTLDDLHAIKFGYSDNVFGSGAGGQFYALATGLDISRHLGFAVQLGYYDLDKAYERSYGYAEMALNGDWRGIGWRLSYVATDSNAEELFIESTVDERVVFTLSLSF